MATQDGADERKVMYMEAYLDNAATTRVFPEVRERMVRVLEEDYGNPSSKHTKGMEAERYVAEAREVIAAGLKCQPKEIIFTSGGTESNNMAILGTAMANRRVGRHIITTRVEHASVHEPFAALEDLGYEATYLPVDASGHVIPEALEEAVRQDTVLVSVMMVNNEVGAWEDIRSLVEIARRKNPRVLFHTDAIQAYGKYKIFPGRWGIDLMSASAHKLHGPKGTGFLYVREGTKLRPVLLGGGQQEGMRSGTENVPAIAGFAEAVRIMDRDRAEKRAMLYRCKRRLIDGLSPLEDVTVNAVQGIDLEETAPHIVSVSFRGIKSEVMLHALAQKGVYVSSGSACSSNHPELSGTLKAIGVKDELLDSTLRFSFSTDTTEAEIDYAVETVAEILPRLRQFVKK